VYTTQYIKWAFTAHKVFVPHPVHVQKYTNFTFKYLKYLGAGSPLNNSEKEEIFNWI